MSLYIFSGGKLPQNTEVIISAWNFAPKGNHLLKKFFSLSRFAFPFSAACHFKSQIST